MTDENRLIMREATHAVILAGDKGKDEVPKWEEFCRNLNLCIIANLYSDYEGSEDKIGNESPILTGSIHQLRRGEDLSSRPMVQALAQLLVRLSKG
ncbi:hypothetical protein [Scytonema sp. NUACC26]|uniref:hypothetical protein n=1 Tax=Scytonema sp. NUACC26 TaxID=3140176 RepID=UPI0034DBC839